MRIFVTSFAYLFWLANNKKVKYPEFCMGYIDETWYVSNCWAQVLTMWSVVTKCAYSVPHLHTCSDWPITEYPDFCLGYSDKTWYVGSDWQKVLPTWSVVTKCAYLIHHWYIYSHWLITKKKSNIISRAFPDISPKAAHALYSVNVANREILVDFTKFKRYVNKKTLLKGMRLVYKMVGYQWDRLRIVHC